MDKPQPRPTAETLPFWQACAEGRLVFQRCRACGHAQFPPRLRCIRCDSPDPEWRESARVGTIHTFTVVERAPTAAFKSDVPYAIALVDLDEGVRMMMNMRGNLDGLAIGRRVRVILEPSSGPWPLPQAELLGETLIFDAFEPGRIYGAHTETVGAALLERWARLYPWDRGSPESVPTAIATVLVMRAYMTVLQPRPPGNVHAGMAMRLIAPVPPGARVTTEITCIGKHEKSGRRFVEFVARSVTGESAPATEATLRLIWAA